MGFMKKRAVRQKSVPAPRLTLWVPTLVAGAIAAVFLAATLLVQR